MFKKSIQLSLANDGIALQENAGQAQLISQATYDSAGDGTAQFVDALATHAQLMKHQPISLVLSNALVRFVVLPWQENVHKRNDWEALANHAFRQQYGLVADDWQVQVDFSTFGQSVIATGVDKQLYLSLMQSAKDNGFKWHSIAPVMAILANHKQLANADWTMVVEPNHILLSEKKDGEFVRFSVMAPPSGEEATSAMQMIARRKLHLTKAESTKKIMVYVSGGLDKSWPKDWLVDDNISVRFSRISYSTNAQWLAGLDK